MTEVGGAKTQAPKPKAKGHGRKAAQDYPGALEKPPAEKFCGYARSPQQHLSSECSVTSTGVGWAGRWSSTTGTTSPNRSDQHHRPRARWRSRESDHLPRRRSDLPPGHYSPPTTGTRLCSRPFAGISRLHNHLSLRPSTRLYHAQTGLDPEHPGSTSVTPPLHLRCTSVTPPLHLRYTSVTPPLHLRYTSVTPPLHLRRPYGGTTEVLRRYYGGATEVLRRCNGGAAVLCLFGGGSNQPGMGEIDPTKVAGPRCDA